ncbi:MAG: threonylcarbamoyl-AMP synthase [Candidatus Woesebacteria bacterium]|nr:MAG: threonylcarbamoyl-AMP synthase [Candidatus Woesebacteria bacterium]
MKVINKFDNKLIINVLKQGGLVIFPCETVYGVAVDSSNNIAVEKLNTYKKRPFGKPYAIMCANQEMAEKYVELNTTAKNLYNTFLPGPVTVISVGKRKVAKGIESEAGTLGVRIPAYPNLLKLIKEFDRPIVATSANSSYQKRPYKITDILDNVSKKQKELVDLIIDVGELPHNEPSTVIDTTFDEAITLRQGYIRLKDENEVLSSSEENTQNVGKELWQKYENYSGKRSIIFALEGEMGTGKTQFTKGLARAMGVTELVVSPTFSLVEEYKVSNSKFVLEHFDAWRLSNSTEMETLGFLKMVENKNTVMSIEWADRVVDVIRKFRDQAIVVWVKIRYGKNMNQRLISWGNI